MDDNLELPTSAPKPGADAEKEEEEQSSGDEDQGPDWTKIPGLSTARPVIPKRGEKDFEPTTHGGSGLQRHVLDRSRSAMLEALKATRTISNKSVSHAIWYPQLKRAHVTVARGIHFTTMGHSVARPSATSESVKKIQRRLELLPEEALYLVERGAMYCWSPTDLPLPKSELLDDLEGIPMSVQQAYTEMIGTEDLTFERYQVYAYLKRLGYVVTRTTPPSPDYPTPSSAGSTQAFGSVLNRLYRSISSFLSRLVPVFVGGRDWWRPITIGRWLHHNMDNTSLFKSLRFLSSGYDVPLHIQQTPSAPASSYRLFYNLYKPSNPFKKTAPPPPDFQVVVVNARTTPMPTISELTDLFGELPELPPPVPRKRVSFAQQKLAASAPTQTPAPQTSLTPASSQASLASRVWVWVWPWSQADDKAKAPRPTNPFPSLKTGKKMVVVAVVDAGTISFFRFGQGVFTEWPMS
ncbi:tRNA-splicing endonuclease subunit sen54 N-term-domain-containing protein [Dichomitus squalens]|uniref:tRNA-splicing endonuclease subunit sen54 N-term-domain-containing protein n=1 Tax=Dichomitus squalens TaxID=114155 RepID=A0A4Q9MRW7_9APHY|nr:tRNA-splicing endonuclease subunit sen54 N-term-domain-containing protein [Dichomitus squalens]